MKLVVFGATGNTGRYVVEQALEAGHEVTAVARKPPALKISHERLEVLRGDVMDPDSVWSGGRKRRGDLGARNQLQPWAHHPPLGGVRNILRGMESVGVERFIGVSASGFVDDPDDTLLMRNVAKQILKSVLRHPYADMVLMEEEVKRGGSEWMIVRPPGSPTAHSGRYRTTINGNVPGSWSVSRADVADFVVTHLRDPS